MRVRRVFSATFCLVSLAAGSCAGGEPATEPDEAAKSAAPADFMDEVETLCAPVAEEHEKLIVAGKRAGFEDAIQALARAEQDLVEALREVEVPAGVREDFETYVDALDDYARAHEAGTSAESLDPVVAASEAAVKMDEVAREMGLPDECPPPASVDVDNDLFVAKANRECLGLFEDAGGEPFDTPRNAKEVGLMLDLARRLTVGIAHAVRDSATPGVRGIPVKKIVRLNKKRFQAIDALAGTFSTGDYGEYRKAGKKLTKVSKKADRTMLSFGLVHCARAFGVIPL